MSKSKEIVPSNGGTQQFQPPVITRSLDAWLREQMGDWSRHVGALQDFDLTKENFGKIGKVFLQGADLEDAGRVLQGYALSWMFTYSETGAAAFLAEHGFSEGTGRRVLADFGLFNSGLTLQQLRRLREIDFTKRPIVAELAGDKLGSLLEGERVSGLTFDGVKAKSHRELEKIAKERRIPDELRKLREENKRLKDDAARRQKAIDQGDELSLEPRGFVFACAEALAIQHRVHTEFALLQQTYDALLAPKTKDAADAWRLDAAQVMYTALGPIIAKADELRETLKGRFGPALTNPDNTHRVSRQAAAEFAKRAKQLEEDVKEAAGKRVEARHTGRGRPAKTLEAGLRKVAGDDAED